MPTKRKPSSSRASKPATSRTSRSAKPREKARPQASRTARHARPVKGTSAPRKKTPVLPKPAVKKVVKVVKVVKAVSAAKAVPPQGNNKAALAAAAASKKAPARPRAVARPPAQGPEVRPLGVLPPEARARGLERSAPGILALPRAARPTNHDKIQGIERVTDEDLKEIEERLLGERQRLMKEMGHLESTVLKVNPRDSAGDLSGYSFHMADAGTDAYEREKAFQVASTEGRLLVEINEALRRLYNGAYGICESCGKPIAKARLLAVPQTRLCRDCKEKEERDHRQEK